MTNPVIILDFRTEFRRQMRRYLRRLGQLALGGLSAGFLLLVYSQTSLPGVKTTQALLDKFGSEVAVPDGRFLLAALSSCCAALILTGWPPTKPFRKWIARPFLGFCFDLAGTAAGAIVPSIIAVSKPAEWELAILTVLLALSYVALMSTMLWFGQYLLSERVQEILSRHPVPYQYIVPTGGALFLAVVYLSSVTR